MKETVTARLYTLIAKGTHHELSASSAADLAQQVLALTGSKQAAQLARAAYGDDQAELTVSGVRLVATGRVVRQVWKTWPAQRSGKQTTEPTAALMEETRVVAEPETGTPEGESEASPAEAGATLEGQPSEGSTSGSSEHQGSAGRSRAEPLL